jgi:hypothetical protein
MYFLKLMDGERFLITDQEAQQAMVSKEERLFINSVKSWINMKSVCAIYPEHISDEIMDKKELQHGVLHDGTKVRRLFGEWVDAYNQVADDNGKYCPVRLDPQYYPEVVLDLVFTEQEYERIKGLTSGERLNLLIERDEDRFRRLKNQTNGLEKVL